MLTEMRRTETEYNPMKLDPAGRERRRGLRIRQNRPIKAFIPSAARFVGGQTQDISATGLRLEIPRSAPVQAGALLNVHVGLDSAGSSLVNRRQMLPARVVWIHDERSEAATVTAGIEFLTSIAIGADAA